ncbi:sensor histidine kinase, partial [Lishizhenia sp.]|uniref:sensor histidine kinase n=1 Tax=Lishizhenia sp. TaxID=2497594 RepID=UPI00299F2C93
YVKYTTAYLHDKQELNEKALLDLEKKYDFEKQKVITEQEHHKAEIAQAEAEKISFQLKALFIFLLTFLVLIFFILRLLLKNKKARKSLQKSNDRLEESLQQKDLLFKELHHRVKNNLTLLQSLLYLRASTSNNLQVKTALKECEHRIHSMAAVHQKLYNLENVSSVNLKEYCNQLISDLRTTVTMDQRKVNINLSMKDISLNISKATQIGLIFNELFINSFKHATPKGETLEIGIDIHHEKQTLILNYHDNGQGFSQDITKKAEGFGFKLIRILSQQLKASYSYNNTNHRSLFTFTIKE